MERRMVFAFLILGLTLILSLSLEGKEESRIGMQDADTLYLWWMVESRETNEWINERFNRAKHRKKHVRTVKVYVLLCLDDYPSKMLKYEL